MLLTVLDSVFLHFYIDIFFFFIRRKKDSVYRNTHVRLDFVFERFTPDLFACFVFFYLVLTFAEVYMFCLWGLQQTLVSLILCSDCDNASAVFV